MSQRLIIRAVRLLLMVVAGGVFALLAAMAGSSVLGMRAASAAPVTTCTTSNAGATANVSLNGTTVTLSVDGSNNLQVATGTGTPTACGSFPTVTQITFTGSATTQTVIFDMTQAGGAIPCTASLSGSLVSSGSSGLLDILAANGPGVTVGSDGINLDACTAAQGSLTGIGTWKLEGTGGSTVLSAEGGSGTNPVTGSVIFVAGTGGETFRSATANTAIDLSNVTCATGPCSLIVNTTGSSFGSSPSVAASTAVFTDSGAAVSYTYDFTGTGADFTSFTGLSGGSTTFAAGNAGGYTFLGNGSGNTADFFAATSGVNVDMHAGPGTVGSPAQVTVPSGTDNVSGITSITGSSAGGNTFTAGPGPTSYAFTAAGSGNTFTGGSGADTFTATGNNSTFKPGTGSATINATGTTGNTVDFSRLSGTVNVNVTGSPLSSPYPT
ncbi:MAG TPA: hypothetical protein VNF71_12080, partial [Acidimicrobiales bacterium]|nr:hypothetical protein [Acidimicrobiales bacterium]